MKYEAQVAICEAEEVNLGGNKLMAVMLDSGHAVLMIPGTFHEMFRKVEADEAIPSVPVIATVAAPVKTRPGGARRGNSKRPAKARGAKPVPVPAETTKKPSPAQDVILTALRDAGPLTSSEVADRYEKAGLSRAACSQTLIYMRERGLVVKRQDPTSNLDKWFIVKEAA